MGSRKKMKLSFGLFALAAAQEVYDPENCTNGNNRCDGTCSQVVFQRESCQDSRIDRACCTVQEACVLINDNENIGCLSFPVVLNGGEAFNCAADCGVVTTTVDITATTIQNEASPTPSNGSGTTGAATTGAATTGGSGTTGSAATTPVATTTAGTILTTVSTLMISLLALH